MDRYEYDLKDSLVEFLLKILLNAKYRRLEQIGDDLSNYCRQKRVFSDIERLEVQLSFSKSFRNNKEYMLRELPSLMEVLLRELEIGNRKDLIWS